MRTFRTAIVAAGIFVALGIGSARADQPLPPPELKTLCATGGFFCAEMDPERNLTTVYRRRAGGLKELLWSMRGWFRVAALSSDGEYLVTGYDGVNLLPLDYRKDQVMLSFYDRGKLTRQVRLSELISDFSKLERTVSHYQWGHYRGINADDHYTVELADKRWILFNVKTGQPIK